MVGDMGGWIWVGRPLPAPRSRKGLFEAYGSAAAMALASLRGDSGHRPDRPRGDAMNDGTRVRPASGEVKQEAGAGPQD